MLAIILHRGDSRALTLCIDDDGIRRGRTKPAPSGMGLTLVSALTEDLGATMVCTEQDGTHYRIDLPAASLK